MNSFMHQHATRPTHFLLVCLLGYGLAACCGEGRDALLGQAKASIAWGHTKAAITHPNDAVVADEKNAEARQRFKWMLVTSSTITPLHLP